MKVPSRVSDRWCQKEVPAPAKKEEIEVLPGVVCREISPSLKICERTKGHIGPHCEGTFLWTN